MAGKRMKKVILMIGTTTINTLKYTEKTITIYDAIPFSIIQIVIVWESYNNSDNKRIINQQQH